METVKSDSILRLLSPITLLATLLLVGIVVKSYTSYNRLRHIPGPWYVGITPLWLSYHTLKCDLYRAVSDKLQKHGSLCRIGPNMVVTNDPVLYKKVTALREPFGKGHWFHGMKLEPKLDNIVSGVDEKAHDDLRTKLMPGYSGKDVSTLEDDVDSQVLALATLISQHVDTNAAFDFAVLSSYFTLDVLTKIAFSRVNGFLTNNKDMFDYFKTTTPFFPIMEMGCNIPSVLNILHSKVMQAVAAPRPSDKVGMGALIGQAHEEVATRFGPDAKIDQDDMLGSFVRHGLSQVECESESVIQIMAGSDSTATALRMTFWHIMNAPIVYSKLSKEISSAVDDGRVSYPVIKDKEAKMLPYLQACIREGLRVFAPLNGLSTRVCPPGGFDYNGIHIPADTQVGISLYSLLRRKDIFGSDADTFRPERFIDADPAVVKKFEQVQELVFGHGRNSCLGKGIALMELGKAVFELLRRFDFTIVNPMDAVFVQSSGVVVQRNMIVRAWAKTSE